MHLMSNQISTIESSVDLQKPFLVADETLSYGELFQRLYKLTTLFEKHGLAKNDKVLIATKNPIAFATTFLSLLRNGITPIIIDPAINDQEIQRLLQFAQIKGAIVDEERQKAWQLRLPSFLIEIKEKSSLLHKLLGQSKKENNSIYAYPQLFNTLEPTHPSNQIDPDEDAYILFTSGTTSKPKGVQISHRSLWHHLETISQELEHTQDSRLLCLLPLHHADGLIHGMMSAFYNKATLFRPFVFSLNHLGKMLESIKSHQITHWITVPSVLAFFDKIEVSKEDSFRTSHFRYVVSAAATLEKNLWSRFEKKYEIPIINTFGLTETVTSGLFCNTKLYPHKIGSLGKPIDCQARVVDENGIDVAPGEVGELILKGSNIMKGYFLMSEMTASVLKDGWLYTGDLVAQDTEGFYHIAGRKKDVIIYNGINIYPEEIVRCLMAHEEVLAAAAFGQEDPICGEYPISCVTITSKSSLQENDLLEHCRKILPQEKLPKKVYFIDSLPRNDAGKIQIEILKELCLQRSSKKPTLTHRDVSQEIIAIAAAVFGHPQEDIALSNGPNELSGWDSMGHMEFVTSLEKHFHFRLSPKEIMRMNSLLKAKEIVEEHLKT